MMPTEKETVIADSIAGNDLVIANNGQYICYKSKWNSETRQALSYSS
jgi:hypothetical protein